jgi:hypothetical protein|tara:strand:+ start:1279 stop:1443 length:165 start_codon:yes stop_codon:yes gene_type:complete
MDIKPVKSIVIPTPLSLGGTFEYLKRYRIDAIATIAKNHPKPDPKPKTTDSIRV